MSKVSVIIPSRNERFLQQTVTDLLEKAQGDVEVIAVLEGYWPDPPLVGDDRLIILHNGRAAGMRGAINRGAALASGTYLMKCDAHCMFDEGYDVKLQADLERDWVAVPRRYALDADNWTRQQKRPIDYVYLCYPDNPGDFGGPSLKGRVWDQKNRDASLQAVEIDDLMSAQGSCWFMFRDYFYWLDLMDEANYGHFSNEFQEIGLKVWLSGGRVIRNKKTWYAHLHKGKKYGRGWPLGGSVLNQGAAFTNRWMDGRNWRKQDRDIRWMVRKFWPVPGWPRTSVDLVFHKARRGGSGIIRGVQMAEHLKARLNPEWTYPEDVHIWIKMQPPDDYPAKSYLDVLDAQERVSWLLAHPDIGVIASSQSGYDYLTKKLKRDDIHLIPQHHCNYERVVRERREIKVAGVVGGAGALQLDYDELVRRLGEFGIEFRWLKQYRSRQEVANFYKDLDLQIVWRPGNRPLKNPLKIINAMSFGIPTIALPDIAYQEVEGFYLRAETMGGILEKLNLFNADVIIDSLVAKAEEYHIDNIAKLYEGLL